MNFTHSSDCRSFTRQSSKARTSKNKARVANYDKLVELKAKWDPDGFFNFQQGIGSDFEPRPPFPNGNLDLSPLSWTL